MIDHSESWRGGLPAQRARAQWGGQLAAQQARVGGINAHGRAWGMCQCVSVLWLDKHAPTTGPRPLSRVKTVEDVPLREVSIIPFSLS